ncbi:hypothetical protein IW261DRAFT_1661382 [Armillaria novae-zelandiae]|uniref:Uncharacterized protein n=1 Tax=Armillaria novae-zelandiae TaxID=153914 RepID=A0AA39UFY3_9AGAR|nr:hypothetical protein IW261DRAFT_1661382 [Armillaria novae-zelandiae]
MAPPITHLSMHDIPASASKEDHILFGEDSASAQRSCRETYTHSGFTARQSDVNTTPNLFSVDSTSTNEWGGYRSIIPETQHNQSVQPLFPVEKEGDDGDPSGSNGEPNSPSNCNCNLHDPWCPSPPAGPPNPGGPGGPGGPGRPGSNPPNLPNSDPNDENRLMVEFMNLLRGLTCQVNNPPQQIIHTKVKVPDTFDGVDLRKLKVFIVSLQLNFNDRPNTFATVMSLQALYVQNLQILQPSQYTNSSFIQLLPPKQTLDLISSSVSKCLLYKLELVLELEQRPVFSKCTRRSPQVRSAVQQMLRITFHGLPELLEASTESESEEMAEPATGPKVSRASPPTGDASSSNEEGEEGIEWDAQALVAEEELVGEATDAGVEEQSSTPPGLDTGSSGLETPLAGQKHVAPASPVPPVATGEDAREPPLKKAKGFTRTGWLLMLNQRLREGWTQPAMHANMEAMQDEGLLLVGTSVLFFCVRAVTPVGSWQIRNSDNGHPSCAECLISSHSCPSCLAPATQAACPPMIPKAPTACRQVVVTVPHIGKVAHEYRRIEGAQMNPCLPVGGDSTTDFAFGLVERLGL